MKQWPPAQGEHLHSLLERLRQEDHEFELRLGYIESHCHKRGRKGKTNNNNK